MKKLLALFLTLLICICFSIGLTACSDSQNEHTHTAGEWIIDKEANCKDSGLKHKECTICNAIIEIDIVSDAYTHDYVYGECEVCDAIDSTYMTEGLIYRLINNGTEYSVVGYTGSDTDVIIPTIYKGKPVVSIGERAFFSCDSLTSVVIPDSVESIGYLSFTGSDNLTIYCEAESQPSSWSYDWNSDRPVVWGYQG